MRKIAINKWLGRLLLIVGAPVLLLALAEGVLRLASYGVQPDFVLSSEVNGEVRFHENPDIGRLWFEPGLVRSPVPFSVPEKTNDLRVVILGESAAMGDPVPAFGIAPFLNVVLKARFPDASIDVINAAMTAIDSSVIVEIARGIAPLKPDYVIVYMGNNELVGPFGPSTDFAQTPGCDAWTTRLQLRARSLRVGQLLRAAFFRLSKKPEKSWKGLELFAERKVSSKSPVLTQVHKRYRDNLDAIVESVVEAGAKPILSTMATRINWPPFLSDRDGDVAAAEKLEAEGQWKGAYFLYRQLVEREPRSAEWQYRAARAMMAMGNVEGGIEGYTRSRDLDELRFRADSKMNELVGEAAGDEFLAVDLDMTFRQFWAQPDRYFWDHVHLSPLGNYIAATTYARALEPLLLEQGMITKGNYPTFDQARRSLTYSEWDRLRLATVMHQRMLNPPFSSISYFDEIIGRLTQEVMGLRKSMTRAVVEGERDLLKASVEENPSDYHFHARLAHVHEELREYAEAHAVYEKMMKLWPQSRTVHRSYGLSLVRGGSLEEGLKQLMLGSLPGDKRAPVVARIEASSVLAGIGEFGEALDAITEALEIDPAYAKAWYNRGIIYGRNGQIEEAQNDFLRAINLDSTMGEAYNNLGVIELKRENNEAAEQWFRKALDQQPLLISAMRNLSLVTMMRGDWETAYDYSRQLSYLDPELSDVSQLQKVPGKQVGAEEKK